MLLLQISFFTFNATILILLYRPTAQQCTLYKHIFAFGHNHQIFAFEYEHQAFAFDHQTFAFECNGEQSFTSLVMSQF